jgi:hypothetical protein
LFVVSSEWARGGQAYWLLLVAQSAWQTDGRFLMRVCVCTVRSRQDLMYSTVLYSTRKLWILVLVGKLKQRQRCHNKRTVQIIVPGTSEYTDNSMMSCWYGMEQSRTSNWKRVRVRWCSIISIGLRGCSNFTDWKSFATGRSVLTN